jgi:hypothetical protein
LAVALDDSELNHFNCGDVITATDENQTYTVHTAPVTGGCEFVFDQDVEIFADKDYDAIKEFSAVTKIVTRVDLDVREFTIRDGDDSEFDLNRIQEAELWVNGERIVNIEDIKHLPKKVVIQGEALEVIKRAVNNRERCTVHVMSRVILLDGKRPKGVKCNYHAQPTLVL